MPEEKQFFPHSTYAQELYRWFESRAGEGKRVFTGQEMANPYGWSNTPARRRWLAEMEKRGMLVSFRFLTGERGSAKAYHWQGVRDEDGVACL